MLRSWWRRFGKKKSPQLRQSRWAHAPCLEALEDRFVPAAVVRNGTGADTAALTAIVDQFRTDLGGANNGVGGSFLTGRREVNWDGVPDSSAAPNSIAADFFNTTSPRGLVFATPAPGTGFQVSSNTASGVPVRFGNINATYTTTFTTFSAQRLFTPLGNTISDQTFFVPGTATPATVSGFGAVFTDVDSASSTTLEFFDQANSSLGVFNVPTLNGGLSFLGVSFNASERVARVRITAGNTALSALANDGGATDVVAMDDFIYAEPQPVRFQFTSATYTVNESGVNALVTVTRTGGTFGAASVSLATTDATALSGFDYTSFNQVLNFVSGEASKTIAIPIHDDVLAEGIETLTLALTGPSAGTILGTPSFAVLTIIDNDTPPVTLLGLTSNNKLVRFDAATPGTILSTVTITGLQAAEVIRGIDFRPATGQLFGLGSSSRLYTINVTTGVATQVGTGAFTPALTGSSFGVDFNPTVDRLRIVSDTDQNLRLNPSTGTVAGTDTNLAYVAGDPNFGANPNVVSSAYTNNFAGSTITTLYGIDSNLDRLVRQGGNGGAPSPNGGGLTTLAPLGFDVQDGLGFDIAAIGNQAFAAMTLVGEATTRLFTIALPAAAIATSVAAPIGAIGGPDAIIGLAVVPPGAFQFSVPAYAVTEGNTTATITVTRTGGSDGVATVNFNVTAGTATAGSDFQLASGILTFNNGETSKTFTVTILDDTVREGAETVLLSLNSPTGGTILGSRSTASLTILDNETPLPFFFGLTDLNKLLRIDPANAATPLSTVTITGLQAGENVLGIDYRPTNGLLYGLGSTSRLYTINTTTGAATQVGSGTFTVPLAGTDFGFDFNPQADRLRVVSNTGQNLRLNPDTGAVVDSDPGTPGVQPDTNLAYVLDDVNFSATPSVVGSAYTNNVAAAAVTTLFGIDSARGQLVRQGGVDGSPSPNGGQLVTIGSLGFTTQALLGFDISADATALAVFTSNGDTVSKVYQINLATGAAIYLGDIGSAELMRGMAIIPAGIVQLSAATFTVDEGAASVTITVNRTSGTEGAVTVNFTTSDGTGRAGIDYTATTGSVTLAAGATSGTFAIPIIGNGRIDGNRTFNVTLTGAGGGATLGATTAAVVTITDNDAALTQNQRFVTQAFFDLLNRQVDAGGLTSFTNLLNSGGTRDQVVRAIVNSVEYRTLVIQGLYQKYLRRAADAGGLTNFLGFLAGGGRVEEIIAAMVGSAEYFAGPGGNSNTTFLAAAFQDILGRPIDAGAQSSFGALLTSGTSRQAVALIIATSPEAFTGLVSGFYIRFLGRAGDAAGITNFVNSLTAGGRQEDVIIAMVASAEYFGRL